MKNKNYKIVITKFIHNSNIMYEFYKKKKVIYRYCNSNGLIFKPSYPKLRKIIRKAQLDKIKIKEVFL